MNNNLLLGSKYYRYDENDNIEIIRVYKCNDLEVKVYSDNNKNDKKKMTIEYLKQNYVKLKPHAYINFCIVSIGNDLDDVIVTMHRTSDIERNEPTPYCVCRQNITDIFANQIIINPDKMYTGCCMSLDTCPPNIDYTIMIACNGMKKSINLCAYMDDSLDDILGILKTKDFDNTLHMLFADHVNHECKSKPNLSAMKSRIMQLDSYDGYCKSLYTLLDQNNFMYDFYRGFNIIPIDEEVTYDDNGVVNEIVTDIISRIYEVNITSTLCIPYWYDIELSDIQNSYTLIMDKNNKLYVIAYISDGPRRIEIESVESEDNIQRMINSTIGSNRSIKQAASHIKLNKNKYK